MNTTSTTISMQQIEGKTDTVNEQQQPVQNTSASSMMSDNTTDIDNEMNKLDDAFAELTAYLEQLDSDDGTNFMPIILSLTPAQLMEKLKAIENYALNLGFEEGRQMHRGRILNIFGGTGGNSVASVGGLNSTPLPLFSVISSNTPTEITTTTNNNNTTTSAAPNNISNEMKS